MAVKFSNNAGTSLSGSISAGATSFTVVSATAFPALGGSDHTFVTLGGSEVVKVTAISGNNFTCVATAGAHSSGANVEIRVTAELLGDFSSLPAESGNSGKFLTTNGSTPSWADVGTTFPFYKANGSTDNISITNAEFPFTKADGSADNIGVS